VPPRQAAGVTSSLSLPASVAAESELTSDSHSGPGLLLVHSAPTGERAVYEAVMGWVWHDVGQRKALLGEVLGAVRMALP
jgi:hypothetical protein